MFVLYIMFARFMGLCCVLYVRHSVANTWRRLSKHCTEKLEQQFEQQHVGSVQAFIDAARRVITTASYVILVVMATWISLRVAALLVLRRLAVTSARPERRRAAFDDELDEQPMRTDNDVVDDVTDDDDDDVSCHCNVTEDHGDVPAPPPVSARQSGILHSLKYYETKV